VAESTSRFFSFDPHAEAVVALLYPEHFLSHGAIDDLIRLAREAFHTSIRNFDKSVGVVHSPAAAISGWVRQRLLIIMPSARCARTALS
jgi:hypothetical protein